MYRVDTLTAKTNTEMVSLNRNDSEKVAKQCENDGENRIVKEWSPPEKVREPA